MIWKADRYGAGYKNVKRHVWVVTQVYIKVEPYVFDRFIPICGSGPGMHHGGVSQEALIESELPHCKKCLRIVEEAVIEYSES